MAKSLDSILAEVTSKSDPQRQIVMNQIAELPTQQAAGEASLSAKKDLAYDEILAGARRRGLGYAGIPLGEQAKYNATEYAPAAANLQSTFSGRKATLESALADIGKSDYMAAQDIYGRDRAFEEGQRQFSAQQSATSALASLYDGNKNPAPTPPAVSPDQDRAYQAVQQLFGTNNNNLIKQTIEAIKKSASYGNAYDQIKLSLIAKSRPDLLAPNNNPAPALQKLGGGAQQINGINFGAAPLNLGGLNNAGLRYL